MTFDQQLQAWGEKLAFHYHFLFHYKNCPFGPELQEAWNHRYALFSKFDQGIKTDAVGLYSVTPEKTAKEIASRVNADTIVDAFCGIGGSVIAFAAVAKKVYAIDQDSNRLALARHNAQIYNRNNVEFIQGDFLQLAAQQKADAVFLDPPWGGPAALDKPTFALNDFSPSGRQLLDLAFRYFPQVILRVPAQFNFRELAEYRYTVQDNFLEGRLISKTVYFHA